MATTIIDLLVDDAPLTAPPEVQGTGELVHNPNLVARSISRLIEYFRRGPRNQAFLKGVVGQVQDLEDSAWSLYYGLRLDNATGVNLDVLGRRVGELRTGRVDDDYRAAIRTRILVNLSKGRVEDLIAIVKSLLPSTSVQVAEYWPPALSFSVTSLGSVTFDTMNRMLLQAKAAGVRLEFTSGAGTIGSEDDTYLGGTIGSEDDTTLGFEIASGT